MPTLPVGYMFFIEIIIGVFLAFAVLFAYHKLKDESYKKFFGNTLVIAALIYVVFAGVGLVAQTASFNWLLIEISGVLIYAVFAYLGITKSFWFLAVGWFAHVLWDVLLHSNNSAAFVPDFYPALCIGFDIVFGVYIAYRFYFRD